MIGINFKRLIRSIVFLLVSTIILYMGMLPRNFADGSFQISPVFFAWSAAFAVRRPKSVGTIPLILSAILYAVYNDEGLALGSLFYLLFCLLVQEFGDALEHQSFIFESLAATLLFFVTQLFKNLTLTLFFTHTLPITALIKFAVIFLICYMVSASAISLIFGRSGTIEASK